MSKKIFNIIIIVLAFVSIPYFALAIPTSVDRVGANRIEPLIKTDGLGVYASSTIGNGNAQSGLTINGNATTTGIIKIQGTATSTLVGSIQTIRSIIFGNSVNTKQSTGGGGPESISIQRTNANDLGIWSGIDSDTEGRWLVETNGLMGWGAGGVSDQDINFYRNGIGNLTIQGTADSTETLRVNNSTGTSILTVNSTSAYVAVPWLLVNGAGGGAKLDVYGGGTTAIRAEQTASSDVAFSSFVTGDAQLRFTFLADGTLQWGSGSAVADTNLYRSAENQLRTSDTFIVDTNIGIGTTSPYAKLSVVGEVVASHFTATSTTATSTFAGDVKVGNGNPVLKIQNGNYFVKVGTNQAYGTTTLASGTATVNNSLIQADSLIELTLQNCSTCGTPYISAKSAGVSFTITSTNGSDASIVLWHVINPIY